MNDDEYDGKDSLSDIVNGYKAVYSALDDGQKMEADVQRALKLLEIWTSPEPVSEEVHEMFVEWFMDYGECRHVEEAFCRYLDQNGGEWTIVPEDAGELLERFWESTATDHENGAGTHGGETKNKKTTGSSGKNSLFAYVLTKGNR